MTVTLCYSRKYNNFGVIDGRSKILFIFNIIDPHCRLRAADRILLNNPNYITTGLELFVVHVPFSNQ